MRVVLLPWTDTDGVIFRLRDEVVESESVQRYMCCDCSFQFHTICKLDAKVSRMSAFCAFAAELPSCNFLELAAPETTWAYLREHFELAKRLGSSRSIVV